MEKNLLETGTYEITGPENGDIQIDKITLHGNNNSKRIWKVKEFSKTKIVLEIEKFA